MHNLTIPIDHSIRVVVVESNDEPDYPYAITIVGNHTNGLMLHHQIHSNPDHLADNLENMITKARTIAFGEVA